MNAVATVIPTTPSTFHRLLTVAAEHKRLSSLAILGSTTLIAAVDLWTGDEIPLMILYLPAIFLCCWVQHLSVGVALSLACATLWIFDDLFMIERSANLPHKYWLTVVHILFFTVVAVMTWRLRLAQEREYRLARTDALTGLLNRKAFVETAQEVIARAQRGGGPLAVAYLDCDNFKQVNDQLGHATGDSLLAKVAEVATANVRPVDSVARLGGDEFACLLPDTSEEEALRVVTQMKQELDRHMGKHAWPVGFSIGLAAFVVPPPSVDQLIGTADELMYQAKNNEKGTLVTTAIST